MTVACKLFKAVVIEIVRQGKLDIPCFDFICGIASSPWHLQFCTYTAYTVVADTLAHVVCFFLLGGGETVGRGRVLEEELPQPYVI